MLIHELEEHKIHSICTLPYPDYPTEYVNPTLSQLSCTKTVTLPVLRLNQYKNPTFLPGSGGRSVKNTYSFLHQMFVSLRHLDVSHVNVIMLICYTVSILHLNEMKLIVIYSCCDL